MSKKKTVSILLTQYREPYREVYALKYIRVLCQYVNKCLFHLTPMFRTYLFPYKLKLSW